MPRRDLIPDAWPRGMRDVVAAAYLGLGLTTFHGLAKTEGFPKAHWPTDGCKIWLREDLDAWLDRLAGRAPDLVDDGDKWLGRVRGEDDAPLRQPGPH